MIYPRLQVTAIRVTPNNVLLAGFRVIPLLLLLSSCAVRQGETDRKEITGTIIVIGNHPFESLALEEENGTVIVIKAERTLQEQLFSLQGKSVTLLCISIGRADGTLTAVISKLVSIH